MDKERQNSLAISNKGKARLTRQQIEFNRVTQKIAALREEIAELERRMQRHAQGVNDLIVPAIGVVAEAELKLAFALEEAFLSHKFPKAVQSGIATCIVDLCQKALQRVSESASALTLLNRWIHFGLESKSSKTKKTTSREPEAAHRDGWEAGPQGHSSAKGGQWTGEQASNFHTQHRKTKAQTKAAEKREAAQKAREEIKSRSLRSIYISVAKLIHPDTEPDPEQKAVKEEEMKRLSAAYEKDDLTTLLQMEMDWIHKQQNHLSDMAAEKLEVYLEVLKEQMHALARERKSLFWSPRFDSIRHYALLKEEVAQRKMKSEARELEKAASGLEKMSRALQGPDGKKTTKEFVENYVAQMDFGWPDDF